MLEYEFEQVAACRGVFVGKSLEHQEVIRRRAREGWRYSGWIPSTQSSGFITRLDLVFEREAPEGKEEDT